MSDEYTFYDFKVYREVQMTIEVSCCGETAEDAQEGASEWASLMDEEAWMKEVKVERVTLLGETPEDPPEPEFKDQDEFMAAVRGWAAAHPEAKEVHFVTALKWYREQQDAG